MKLTDKVRKPKIRLFVVMFMRGLVKHVAWTWKEAHAVKRALQVEADYDMRKFYTVVVLRERM